MDIAVFFKSPHQKCCNISWQLDRHTTENRKPLNMFILWCFHVWSLFYILCVIIFHFLRPKDEPPQKCLIYRKEMQPSWQNYSQMQVLHQRKIKSYCSLQFVFTSTMPHMRLLVDKEACSLFHIYERFRNCDTWIQEKSLVLCWFNVFKVELKCC